MRPTHQFTVTSEIPDSLSALPRLAANLHWAWDRELAAVFDRIDGRDHDQTWRRTGQHPADLVRRTDPSCWVELAANVDFVDAAAVADVLGIEIEHVNFAADYKDRVFAEFLREKPACHIRGTAGGEAHHQPHWAIRPSALRKGPGCSASPGQSDATQHQAAPRKRCCHEFPPQDFLRLAEA